MQHTAEPTNTAHTTRPMVRMSATVTTVENSTMLFKSYGCEITNGTLQYIIALLVDLAHNEEIKACIVN